MAKGHGRNHTMSNTIHLAANLDQEKAWKFTRWKTGIPLPMWQQSVASLIKQQHTMPNWNPKGCKMGPRKTTESLSLAHCTAMIFKPCSAWDHAKGKLCPFYMLWLILCDDCRKKSCVWLLQLFLWPAHAWQRMADWQMCNRPEKQIISTKSHTKLFWSLQVIETTFFQKTERQKSFPGIPCESTHGFPFLPWSCCAPMWFSDWHTELINLILFNQSPQRCCACDFWQFFCIFCVQPSMWQTAVRWEIQSQTDRLTNQTHSSNHTNKCHFKILTTCLFGNHSEWLKDMFHTIVNQAPTLCEQLQTQKMVVVSRKGKMHLMIHQPASSAQQLKKKVQKLREDSSWKNQKLIGKAHVISTLIQIDGVTASQSFASASFWASDCWHSKNDSFFWTQIFGRKFPQETAKTWQNAIEQLHFKIALSV